MTRYTVLIAIGILLVAGSLLVAQKSSTDPAMRLKEVGVALRMYAADNKAFLPPDLQSLSKYLGGKVSTEGMVYVIGPGTRINRVRQPSTQPAVMLVSGEGNDEVIIVYVDGHVQAYVKSDAREGAVITPGVAAATRAAAAAPMVVQNEGAPPAGVPADVAGGLIGAWQVNLGEFVATYHFKKEGTFVLTFVGAPGSSFGRLGAGAAGGTWTMENNKLVMTNTASDTSFTVVGEKEEAQVMGLNENTLVLKTTNRKGAEEHIVLRRTVPFEKGKNDNANIVGTWSADRMTLVLAESGMVVLGPMKGEWAQHGSKLTLVLSGEANQRGSGQAPGQAPTTLDFTIDLVNETTLVLTGSLDEGRKPATMTFLRVK